MLIQCGNSIQPLGMEMLPWHIRYCNVDATLISEQYLEILRRIYLASSEPSQIDNPQTCNKDINLKGEGVIPNHEVSFS